MIDLGRMLRAWSRTAWPQTLALTLVAVSATGRADDLSGSDWQMKLDPPASRAPTPAPTPARAANSKELAIPFPSNFGGGGEVIYPSTPSSFVAIGKNAFDNDVRQVWDLSTRKMVGALKGQTGFDEKTIALSSDGVYLAGKPTFRKSVEVRATKNGKLVQSFDIDSPFLDFVDFAAQDRVVFGRLQDKKLQVADIKSGDKVCDLTLIKEADRQAIALSPGRGYLAAASWWDGTLRVYDLGTGKLAGEAPTPKKNGQNVRCQGLGFSPDGSELAGLFESFGEHRIVLWSATDGKMLADFDLGKDIQRPAFYASEGITWFPDKSALLVLGYAIVDRASGKKVWTLPFDGQNLKASPRRFLDADHALVVSSQPSMALRSTTIPRDKIAGAVQIVRSGGNAADAALPPLTPADRAGVKMVDLRVKPGAWGVKPRAMGAAPRRLTSRPVTMKGKADDFRGLLFPGGDSTQVVAVGTPQQFGQPNPTDGQPRWVERFDLAGAKALGRVDLPSVVDPIDVSPDASMLLLRESKARDRLDVVAIVDGKPVSGWRPYDKESGEGRVVAWASMLGPQRVLSVSGSGTLVLWNLPKCQAVYEADDAFVGSPVVSPDRVLVAGFDGRGLRVLDSATGTVRGEAPGPANLGRSAEMKAAAFRPDGRRLVGLFPEGQVVLWDLETGKLASQFRLDQGLMGSSVEWAGLDHALLDNRLLVDLRSQRVVWEYVGGMVGHGGPDGRHWRVVRGLAGQESARLVSIDLIDPSLEKAEALLADAKAPAVLRPGYKVSLRLDLTGPPKDPQGFRQGLVEAITAKLKKVGLSVVEDGQPTARPRSTQVSYVRAVAPLDARLVVTVREKDTGQTIQYRGMGAGFGEIKVVKLVDLVCEMSLVDASGPITWMNPETIPMQPFGFVLRMPAGENDPETYLKKLQWDRVKTWATTAGPPYMVAREANQVVRLPGWTDLNVEFAK